MSDKKKSSEALGRIGRVEKEKQLTQRIRIISIAVLAVVAAILIYGFIMSVFVIPDQAIATINGEEILTKSFQARVSFEREQLLSTYNQWYNYLVQNGSPDPNDFVTLYAVNNMNQIAAELDTQSFGLNTLNIMIEDVAIKQAANQMGITVTTEEIDLRMEELFGFFFNGQPAAETVPTVIPTSTLTAEQLQIATVAPTATPQKEVVVTPVETETSATEPDQTNEVEASPTAAYTYEDYQAEYQSFLERFEEYKFGEADLRQFVEAILYREKLLDKLFSDLPRTEPQAWVRHILVATEEEAQDIYSKLLAGEDFAELAAKFSTDSSNAYRGGDLGWFNYESMVPEFSEVAFNLAVGEFSEPFETQFGFHIIQAVGNEERPLDENSYVQKQYAEFSQYVSGLVDAAEVVVPNNWTSRIPDQPPAPALIDLEQLYSNNSAN